MSVPDGTTVKVFYDNGCAIDIGDGVKHVAPYAVNTPSGYGASLYIGDGGTCELETTDAVEFNGSYIIGSPVNREIIKGNSYDVLLSDRIPMSSQPLVIEEAPIDRGGVAPQPKNNKLIYFILFLVFVLVLGLVLEAARITNHIKKTDDPKLVKL